MRSLYEKTMLQYIFLIAGLYVLFGGLISFYQTQKPDIQLIDLWKSWCEKHYALIDRCHNWRWLEWRTPLQIMFKEIEK